MDKQTRASKIKQQASALGFEYCGIAKAERLDDDARRLENWLKNGYHGKMSYMENHFDLRVDPTRLVPGAKSVITLLLNYFPEQPLPDSGVSISKYAYGEDYHEVIREKLRSLLSWIKANIGEVEGRGFVDSAPVLERSWAQRAGLGWIGKNGNLITRNSGSFVFLATLITDLELQTDDAFAKDFCGSCTRCIDECPTGAILPGKQVDGSKCISYFTIELKEMIIPSEMQGRFRNWMFGCDTCQDVCPWNRFASPTSEKAFKPLTELVALTQNDWEELSEESFRRIFKHSPIKRAKFQGVKRNLAFLKGINNSSGDQPH